MSKLTVDRILKEHGLDFTIDKRPLVAIEGTGKNKKILTTPYFGLYNSSNDDCINTCKKGYTITQNREIIELVLEGMKPFGDTLKVHKAASINNGRKVVVQLEIAGTSKVGKDTIKKYVTIIDSNDGSTGLSVGVGDLTMSCLNQFFRFYKRGESKFRHTSTIEARIQEMPDLIKRALKTSLEFANTYKTFASTPVSKKLAHSLVNAILGHDRLGDLSDLNSKAINHMDALYENIEHQTNEKGLNLWGLHSGVTRWTTHHKNAPKRNNGKLESMLIGSSYTDNQTSFDFCVNEAGILTSKSELVILEG